jgi:hypothetical protein
MAGRSAYSKAGQRLRFIILDCQLPIGEGLAYQFIAVL